MRHVRAIPLLFALLLALGTAPAATIAQGNSGGNSENAAKCENGRYLDHTDANGNPFRNAGQCTHYGAQGGELVPVTTGTVTITFYATQGGTLGNNCGFFVDVTGFEPGIHTLNLSSTGPGGAGDYAQSITVVGDGTGRYQSYSLELQGGSVERKGATLTATLNGVSSDPTLVAC